MSSARIEAMLDAIADERDRLDEEVEGVEIAVMGGCVSVVIAGLLLPGVGLLAAAIARRACSVGDADQLRARIDIVEGVIRDLEALGDRVKFIDPTKTQAVDAAEAEVRATLTTVRRVSIVDDLLSQAAAAARGAINNVLGAADAIGNLGLGIAALVAVGAGVYFFGGRR